MTEGTPLGALADVVGHLRRLGRDFALVGGLAVSLRAEVRFTRDVDLAITSSDDADVERLVFALRDVGYDPIAVVEHQDRGRLATARLGSPSGVVVDLIAATTGIEAEIVAEATPVPFEEMGELLVARAEELLAMKVLSASDRRLQDRVDAQSLILLTEGLDLDAVRKNLERITQRGFHRGQDLMAKLDDLLRAARS